MNYAFRVQVYGEVLYLKFYSVFLDLCAPAIMSPLTLIVQVLQRDIFQRYNRKGGVVVILSGPGQFPIIPFEPVSDQ